MTDPLALPVNVLLLAGDAEDPELLETVDDAPVMRDVSAAELDDTVDPPLEEALAEETSDELLVEDVAAEEAEDDKLGDELAALATWAASELWIALSRLDGIQVVSELEYPANARPNT
jgi:hypothetical protein